MIRGWEREDRPRSAVYFGLAAGFEEYFRACLVCEKEGSLEEGWNAFGEDFLGEPWTVGFDEWFQVNSMDQGMINVESLGCLESQHRC